MSNAAEPRALEGILVVALEQAVAAPLCTSRLAEAGARVIKIERPEGDFARHYDHVVNGESAYFVWLNRGKESIALDLKRPDDAALLEAMLTRADIYVQNLAPGAAARLGFGSADLRARHPRLITCDISGYGEDGPARDMKAYDLLIQCEAGLAAITGTEAGPGRVGVSVADIGCGMNAHAAILQTLYRRTTTGRGSGCAVSLFDTVADWMTVPLLHHEHGDGAPRRMGLRHPSIAPYGAFDTADGRSIVLSVQNEREWARMCAALDRPDLAADARFADNVGRVANRDALDVAIASTLSAITHGVAVERLRAASIAFASVNEVADLATHAQLRRTNVETAAGPVSVPASPVRWVDGGTDHAAVPQHDRHGSRLRAEFG